MEQKVVASTNILYDESELDRISIQQILDINEFLTKSEQEINRRQRLKNAFIIIM
ncbi:MAG: hypothetical protein IIA88_00525 [Bacteroidetes bacterium]|nr:hypothetical protein [Bacteroidota bacterium]